MVQPVTRLRPNCSMIAGQKAGRSAAGHGMPSLLHRIHGALPPDGRQEVRSSNLLSSTWSEVEFERIEQGGTAVKYRNGGLLGRRMCVRIKHLPFCWLLAAARPARSKREAEPSWP